MPVTVRFLGSGDSFGSGGRLQTCILIDGMGCRVLLDCGASALISMRRYEVDPNSVELIVVSHLHGDHCAGIPFVLMDAMLGSKRRNPLTIAGPRGVARHLAVLQRALFPGSDAMSPTFDLTFVELQAGETRTVNGVSIGAHDALHTPETQPLILRISGANKVVAFTGDTAWTPAIVSASDHADLLISECYYYEKPIPMHMTYATFRAHRQELRAKAVVLTHMSHDMLAHTAEVPEQCAYDGMAVEI
jgi:ribonuclease BN (tRNA processing enzyme)